MGPKRDMGRARAFKLVSETVRERETFKYVPTLIADSLFNDAGLPLPSSLLRTAADPVLTALAQLGACQTRTSRALVSVFDAERQHFLAEATPSMLLGSSLSSEACCEALGLCGTAIPRGRSTCETALLGPAADAEGHTPDETLLPLTLIPDISADARSCHNLYGSADNPARFYAAVPIRTQRGINIGVYCVVHDEAGREWSDAETERLRAISRALMLHLDTLRSGELQRRNERMNRGLGSFVEGKATMSGWRFELGTTSFHDISGREGALNARQQALGQKDMVAGVQVSSDTSMSVDDEGAANSALPGSSQAHPAGLAYTAEADYQSADGTAGSDPNIDDTTKHSSETLSSSDIFSRAANLIRESIEVEGCLFYDATMGTYRTPTDIKGNKLDAIAGMSSSSSSDESPNSGHETDNHAWPPSELVGFSTSDGSSIDGSPWGHSKAALADRFLSKLLRRYPKGKIFLFDVHGDLLSSDSSEDDHMTQTRPRLDKLVNEGSRASGPANWKQTSKDPWTKRREGSRIYELFPGARSVAFFPVWDPKKDRWRAGGFVYTRKQTRTFTVEADLSYLRAFGAIVASEILKLNLLREEQAKTDVLGSLSHELRSPLHGALLSSELLIDTSLDVLQGNLAHTIDTCCRTLLDTLDHLLDYSGINSLSGKPPSRHANGNNSISSFSKSLYSDVRIDRLLEEVVESVHAGFMFQHQSIKQASVVHKSSVNSDVAANQYMDTERAIEQVRRSPQDEPGPPLGAAKVPIFVSIETCSNWLYNVQVGAVRRIIMNLFGNAVKYTSAGSIWVSLSQETASIRRRRKERVVKIVIRDTGRGIGPEYLRDKLFAPFAQEDSISPGTGLGLSLTKRITAQLGGHISIASEVGKGTTATVILPLRHAATMSPPELRENSEAEDKFTQQLEDVRGLRVRLVLDGDFMARGHEPEGHHNLEKICREWLHMEVISDTEATEKKPDLTIWSEEALHSSLGDRKALAENANVVICSDAVAAYRQSLEYEATGHSNIVEFVSQPIGPRKLAKTLMLAFERWSGLSGHVMSGGPMLQAARSTTPLPRSSGVNNSASSARTASPPETQSCPNGTHNGQEANGEVAKGAVALEQQEAPPVPSLLSSTTGSAADDQPRKFLLVDDNLINLRILVRYMAKLGIAHTTALNGKEAVDAFISDPGAYCCILMDISMPVMDGFEATRQIRAHEAATNGSHDSNGADGANGGGEGGWMTHTPIVALSGLASDDAQREAFGSGMDMYLTKPVKLRTLEEFLSSQGFLMEKT